MSAAPHPQSMRRDFTSREELHAYLRQQFPELAAKDASIAPTAGGRQAALAKLEAIEPGRYGSSRNHLDGAVTRLSPYIRHGMLSLAEVRDRALAVVGQPFHAAKFITELAWREYWQRLYRELGRGIWTDQEALKTGHAESSYSAELPQDIEEGTTGLACMDGFSQELRQTGYLHNHARMWFAAYVVHWRKIRWQAGARWFLTHLLDGDPASNNLSWQWVASTFSHKPYFFNRENVEKYTGGRYCRHCPAAKECPFDASYSELEERLFPRKAAESVSLPLYPRSSGSLHRSADRQARGTAKGGRR
jgi:deoxyribodipyrimidine photo-lyase